MTDQEMNGLLKRAAEGDKAAFEKVYELTRDDVYRTVSFLTSNSQDIQDIVHEVYIQLWRSLSRYDSSRPFRFWLHGLILRQVQDWRRKIWRRIRLINRQKAWSVEEPSVQVHDRTLRNETRHEIVSAVRNLSYKLRVVIVMRYFHHYTFEEIASLLGIPVGTVKSRHNLAIKALRRQFEKQWCGKESAPYVI